MAVAHLLQILQIRVDMEDLGNPHRKVVPLQTVGGTGAVASVGDILVVLQITVLHEKLVEHGLFIP